jgi:hypothetical protein
VPIYVFCSNTSSCAANRLFRRRAGPHAMNAKGIGIRIAERQPSNVPDHCTPRLTNGGEACSPADRRMVLTANTDAHCSQAYQLVL